MSQVKFAQSEREAWMAHYFIRPGWRFCREANELLAVSDTKSITVTLPSLEDTDNVHELLTSHRACVDPLSASLFPAGLCTALEKSHILLRVGDLEELSPRGVGWTAEDRYYLHLGITPRDAKAKLTASRIVVFGVGGLGSIIFHHLAAAGIGTIHIVDDDVVKHENLHRQLIFAVSDIGKPKVHAAKSMVASFGYACTVYTHQARVSTESDVASLLSDIGEIDFCAICIDEPLNSIFIDASNACWRRQIPSVFGGVTARRGFFGPILSPSRTPDSPMHYALWSEVNHDRDDFRISFAPFNTAVAAGMAGAIIHHLIDRSEPFAYEKRRFFDFR